MNPAEVKKVIAMHLLPKKRAALTRADFLTAWQALTNAQKDQIVQAALAGNSSDAGIGLERMLNSYARGLAQARADEITSDGSLGLAEFSEVFGGLEAE